MKKSIIIFLFSVFVAIGSYAKIAVPVLQAVNNGSNTGYNSGTLMKDKTGNSALHLGGPNGVQNSPPISINLKDADAIKKAIKNIKITTTASGSGHFNGIDIVSVTRNGSPCSLTGSPGNKTITTVFGFNNTSGSFSLARGLFQAFDIRQGGYWGANFISGSGLTFKISFVYRALIGSDRARRTPISINFVPSNKCISVTEVPLAGGCQTASFGITAKLQKTSYNDSAAVVTYKATQDGGIITFKGVKSGASFLNIYVMRFRWIDAG